MDITINHGILNVFTDFKSLNKTYMMQSMRHENVLPFKHEDTKNVGGRLKHCFRIEVNL